MALTDDQLEELETFLHSEAAGEQALGLDESHGFLTALVCADRAPDPADWVPVVLGGEPRFRDRAQAERIGDLLMGLFHEVAEALEAEAMFTPIFVEPPPGADIGDADALGWCRGFVRGMSLTDEAWSDEIEGELAELLYPILAIVADADLEPGEAPLIVDAEMYREFVDLIPDNVELIYAHRRREQQAPLPLSPAAAEPCPCGSGESFGECCGRPRRTLH